MIRQEEIIQFNKFAEFHNGKTVFFCKSEYIPSLFFHLKNYNSPTVIISGNSDHPVTDEFAALAPSCIKKWFAQCVNTDNPLLEAMPYGIENTDDCIVPDQGAGHGRHYKLLYVSNPPKRKARKDLYANFSLNTTPIREKVRHICESLPYVTNKLTKDHLKINDNPYQQYVSEIIDHRMIVCPRGNAPAETHRFWEVLYLNRVPIIKKNKGNSFFLDLPVVALDDWEQLRDMDFLNSEYEKVKDNSREMLKMSYWRNKITNEC